MTETIAIYVPTDDLIPIDELLELTGLENVEITTNADDDLLHYDITWDDVKLTISPAYGEDNIEAIAELQALGDELLDNRQDKRARKVRRRLERMDSVYRCVVEPTWDDNRKAQTLIQGIMAYYDYAFLFVDDAIYNENGNREIGVEESSPKLWQIVEEVIEESGEAAERKRRSINVLKKAKIPTIDHLPTIINSEEYVPRSIESILQRALCCWLIAKRAEGISTAEFEQRLAQYQLNDAISPDEQTFAYDEEPIEQDVIKFSGRLEACWVLLWTLGFIRELSKPDQFCNVDLIDKIIETRSTESLLMEAELRTAEDVLDAADLIYRYHWAVIDAELYGRQPPAKLEPTVVYQRHYALNWLIRHREQEWDSVTTDT